VVRFVTLEPTCQCQLVTSWRSLAAGEASAVFAGVFASGGVGAILTVLTAAVASVGLTLSDGNLSDFASGGASSIAEGGAASALATIVRVPMLILSANSALKDNRQIKASQTVLRIAIAQPSQDVPRRSEVSGIKKAVRRLFTERGSGAAGGSNQRKVPKSRNCA